MRFDPKTATKIASGRATVLILPTALKVGSRHSVSFEDKRTYEDGPNPDGLETIWRVKCRVLITDVAELPLGDVTDDDAKDAGFKSLHLFREHWQQTREWSAFTIVHHHCIEVVREDDPVRFMATKTGYTSVSALSIDPDAEAVPHAWQEQLSRESELQKRQRVVRDRIDRGMLSAEERLQRVRAEAKQHRVDVTRQETRLLAALQRRDKAGAVASIESMERKVRSKAA